MKWTEMDWGPENTPSKRAVRVLDQEIREIEEKLNGLKLVRQALLELMSSTITQRPCPVGKNLGYK
jgi:hypothetical protein